jgi:putative ABC transport system permease protein
MVRIYFKIALKNILKFPLLTGIKIISLTLAMLAIIFISLWVKDELSFDNRIAHSERLYRLTIQVNDPEHGLHSNFARCYQAWPYTIKSEFPEIEDVIRISAIHDNIVKINEEKLYVRFHEVDSTFFRIFNVPLIIGNSASVFAQASNIVLSESMANRLFGHSNPLGKSLQMFCQNCSEKKEYSVTGIMKDIPRNSHFHMDMVGSFPQWDKYTDWAYYYVLFKPGVRPAQLIEKLPAFFKKNKAEDEFRISKIQLQPVRDIHLKSSKDRELEDNGTITGIYLFIGIGAFVLVISLLNFFNLRMAGMISQIKTGQTMKVFGATNLDVIYQVIMELLILIICSILLAIIGLLSLRPEFNMFSGKDISFQDSGNIQFIGIIVLALFLVTLMAGVYPAIVLYARNKLVQLTSNQSNTISSTVLSRGIKPSLMKNLIILQFIAAIMLISGSMAIIKQNKFLMSKRLGNEESNLVCVKHLPVQVVDRYIYFRSELIKSPLIKDVTSTFEDPAEEALDKFKYETSGIRDNAKDKFLYVYPAADNIFNFYKIPFLAGSDFPIYYGNDSLPESYILNESALKTLGWKPEEAIGKNFKLIFDIGGKNLFHGGKITGVVRDFYTGSAKHKIEPMVYFQKKFWQFSCQVRIDTSKRMDALSFIKKTWNSVYTDYPFDYSYVEDLYRNIYKQELRQQKLLSIFTVVSILISCMGLWSISNLITRQRTKEIGIRKVNGANVLDILIMMNSEFISLVIIAFIISLPLSWYLINQWLQNFANKINIDASIFVIAGLIALFCSIATVSWQSYGAARINPVKALRYE